MDTPTLVCHSITVTVAHRILWNSSNWL